MVKLAILQVADTGPLESLVAMLQAVGIECAIPDTTLKNELRGLGCDTVLDIKGLVEGMGYDQPMKLPEAHVADMRRSDVLYVDIKAHRNGPRIWKRWPNLKKRTLWYRINGGKPEHVIKASGEDCGDEANPPCPVLTPDQWYNLKSLDYLGEEPAPWADKSYCCWPPFVRMGEYNHKRNMEKHLQSNPTPPICLIHNVAGWGYQALTDGARQLGVKCYGAGSPDGLINHREIAVRLSSTVCMVHLKSNDAPGYALYEALAAACPVVCTHRLIWRCMMQELLIPGETCLTFDQAEHHGGLSPEDVETCLAEIKAAIVRLSDPVENIRIGAAGRKRLQGIMWNTDNENDRKSLADFLGRMYS